MWLFVISIIYIFWTVQCQYTHTNKYIRHVYVYGFTVFIALAILSLVNFCINTHTHTYSQTNCFFLFIVAYSLSHCLLRCWTIVLLLLLSWLSLLLIWFFNELEPYVEPHFIMKYLQILMHFDRVKIGLLAFCTFTAHNKIGERLSLRQWRIL